MRPWRPLVPVSDGLEAVRTIWTGPSTMPERRSSTRLSAEATNDGRGRVDDIFLGASRTCFPGGGNILGTTGAPDANQTIQYIQYRFTDRSNGGRARGNRRGRRSYATPRTPAARRAARARSECARVRH